MRLGKTFLIGEGCNKDYEQAAYCLKEAAETGSDEAASLLIEMQEFCKGVAWGNQDELPSTWLDEHWDGKLGSGTNLRPSLDVDRDRCPICEARVLSRCRSTRGGFECVTSDGGCGARLYLSIEEDGLCGGMAMQPYKESQNPIVYSFFGRCVHEVKYGTTLSNGMKLQMVEEAARRIRECAVADRLLGRDGEEEVFVVPAPSSVRRPLQLVHAVAKAIAEGRYKYCEPLRKHTSYESKNRPRGAELAEGEITCEDHFGRKVVLLIDDTYGEGATLRACIRALRKAGAQRIYFLALCRNTYGGVKGRE